MNDEKLMEREATRLEVLIQSIDKNNFAIKDSLHSLKDTFKRLDNVANRLNSSDYWKNIPQKQEDNGDKNNNISEGPGINTHILAMCSINSAQIDILKCIDALSADFGKTIDFFETHI